MVAASDDEFGAFYGALFTSELGHYKVFLALARKIGRATAVEARWQDMLAAEARILSGAAAWAAVSIRR